MTDYSLLLVALEARKERNVGIRETVQVYSSLKTIHLAWAFCCQWPIKPVDSQSPIEI